MLAHLEEVRHVHPHPAGVPWEAVLLGAVVLVALAAFVGLMLRRAGASALPAVADGAADREAGEPGEGTDHE